VDPSKREVDVVASRLYAWTGFPRPLLVDHRDDRRAAWDAGENRNEQIEYLEWHVERAGDTITRVTFTTETPEYWKLLATVDPDRVVALYRQCPRPCRQEPLVTRLTPATATVLASLGQTRADLLSGIELPTPPTGSEAGAEHADRAAAPPGRAPDGRAPGEPPLPTEPVYGREAGNDIQGSLIPGFNKDHQQFVFLRLGDLDPAREWLRWLAPRLATMNDVLEVRREFRAARLRLGVREPGLAATWLSVAFSHKAIAALAGPLDAAQFGDESFRQGLAARSQPGVRGVRSTMPGDHITPRYLAGDDPHARAVRQAGAAARVARPVPPR
jgi:hypothetical protein